MKKIFILMVALLMTASSFAQVTVNGSKFFENMYVGAEAGVQSSMIFDSNYGKTVLPVAGIEIGKDITPSVGFSLEGLAAFNTDNSLKTINNTNIVGNIKLNLMNAIGSYKGTPRTFEVLLVPGFGWGHLYDTDPIDKNYITFNTFAQFNFNLGDAKAWAINIKPGVVWNAYNNTAIFNHNTTNLRFTVGVSYKFKSKRSQSHNFVVCPYTVTKADYEAALAQVESYKNKPAERVEVVREVPVEKVIEKEVVKTAPGVTYITFKIGSTSISAVEFTKILNWARQLDEKTPIEIVGSADTSTGSQRRNQYLAETRAQEVRKVLVENCGITESRINTSTQFDFDSNSEASRSAVLRVL